MKFYYHIKNGRTDHPKLQYITRIYINGFRSHNNLYNTLPCVHWFVISCLYTPSKLLLNEAKIKKNYVEASLSQQIWNLALEL
jgi:hypothetical protein